MLIESDQGRIKVATNEYGNISANKKFMFARVCRDFSVHVAKYLPCFHAHCFEEATDLMYLRQLFHIP